MDEDDVEVEMMLARKRALPVGRVKYITHSLETDGQMGRKRHGLTDRANPTQIIKLFEVVDILH